MSDDQRSRPKKQSFIVRLAHKLYKQYYSVPEITRVYGIAIVFMFILNYTRVVEEHVLHLNWELIIYKLQIQRLATQLFFPTQIKYTKVLFWVREVYSFLGQISQIELQLYHKNKPQFLYFLILSIIFFNVCSLMNYFIFGQAHTPIYASLIIALIYLYSREKPRGMCVCSMLFFKTDNFSLPYI